MLLSMVGHSALEEQEDLELQEHPVIMVHPEHLVQTVLQDPMDHLEHQVRHSEHLEPAEHLVIMVHPEHLVIMVHPEHLVIMVHPEHLVIMVLRDHPVKVDLEQAEQVVRHLEHLEPVGHLDRVAHLEHLDYLVHLDKVAHPEHLDQLDPMV